MVNMNEGEGREEGRITYLVLCYERWEGDMYQMGGVITQYKSADTKTCFYSI